MTAFVQAGALQNSLFYHTVFLKEIVPSLRALSFSLQNTSIWIPMLQLRHVPSFWEFSAHNGYRIKPYSCILPTLQTFRNDSKK